MNSDIVDLRSFYASLLGRLAERAITMALSAMWAKLPNERLVGLGYALPWLERFGGDAERVFAFMPAHARRGELAAGRAVVDGAGVRRGTAAGRFLRSTGCCWCTRSSMPKTRARR